MKKLLSVLSISLAFAASAALAQNTAPAAAPAAVPAAPPAADPAAVKAANELLTSMNYRAVVQGMFGQMRQSMPTMMEQGAAASINGNAQLDAAQKTAALDKMHQELPQAAALMDGVFNDPTLLDEMMNETAQLYARHFKVKELRQIAAFYKSPVGAKMLSTMPQVMNESMQMGQRLVMPRIGAIMQKMTQPK